MKIAQNAVLAEPVLRQKSGSFLENKLRSVLKIIPMNKSKQEITSQADLTTEIKEIKEKLRNVQNRFNLYTDFDMTDACIYEMESLEARYRFLIKKAKKEKAEQSPVYSVQKD